MSEQQITVQSDEELLIASKAINEYRDRLESIRRQEEFLKDKRFPMGTFVSNQSPSYMDSVFGVTKEPGKIIGWDFKNNYYRVYYSKDNSYIGVYEDQLELFVGQVPPDVFHFNPYIIKRILVNL